MNKTLIFAIISIFFFTACDSSIPEAVFEKRTPKKIEETMEIKKIIPQEEQKKPDERNNENVFEPIYEVKPKPETEEGRNILKFVQRDYTSPYFELPEGWTHEEDAPGLAFYGGEDGGASLLYMPGSRTSVENAFQYAKSKQLEYQDICSRTECDPLPILQTTKIAGIDVTVLSVGFGLLGPYEGNFEIYFDLQGRKAESLYFSGPWEKHKDAIEMIIKTLEWK